MKEYKREYPFFALCGLNCGLCPRYHTDGSSKCPGCGGKDFHLIHPTCSVITCNQKHDNVEYCFQCSGYACKKYESASATDSFIPYQNVIADFDKAKKMGLLAYQTELDEKARLLRILIETYNDGRRKNYYCIAVNLLELSDVQEIMTRIDAEISPQEIMLKEKVAQIVALFEAKAKERNVMLALRKKDAAK